MKKGDLKNINTSSLPNWDSIVFDDTWNDDITKKVIGSISPSRDKNTHATNTKTNTNTNTIPNTNYIKKMLDDTSKIRNSINMNNDSSNQSLINDNNNDNSNILSMSVDRNDGLFLCRGNYYNHNHYHYYYHHH